MKILMFTKLAMPHIGGVEVHIHKVSNILVDRGHQVTVITSNVGLPYDARYIQIHGYELAYGLVPNFDIVHCHDFEQYIPGCYMTFHGYEGHCPPNPQVVAIRRTIAKQSKGCMFVGKYLKNWYDSTNPNEQIIWGGVDPAPTFTKRKEGVKTITYVGRMAADKGTSVYKDAANELQDMNCLFIDNYPNQKIRSLWNQSDLAFANGQLAILEAMSCGVPVIAYASNDMVRDMLTECPVVNIAKNKQEIVGLVTKLRDNNEFYQVCSRAGWIYANEHTWEHIADQYEKLWGLK